MAGALSVRHGEGLQEEGQAPALALPSPAAEVSSEWEILGASWLRGVDHTEPAQAEHLTPPRVRHPGVELIQPAGLGLEAGGGQYHSTEI